MNNQPLWSVENAGQRLAHTIKRIEADSAELKNVFTQTFFKAAKDQVSQLNSAAHSPLSGALISVKDLLDVKGFVTRAGTRFLQENSPAKIDATLVGRLREAGAIFVGHSNMTELAYSGLGLNPHYGTPENALYPNCIPGGSSAGGAVSVAQGVVDIAIGTDTGGSVRIPAAFNGLVGFKPTQKTVSRQGCKTLSFSLDSIGPLAKTVAACRMCYQTMATPGDDHSQSLQQEFVIPTNFGMDDLDPVVAQAFEQAVAKMSDAGINIREENVPVLERFKALPLWLITAVECRAEYDHYYKTSPELFDPRVLSRLKSADGVSAVTYRETLIERENIMAQYRHELGGRVILLPTTPILPPTFEQLELDAEFDRFNLLALRNPSLANIIDGCSISLPYESDSNTIGIMLTAAGGFDHALLDMADHCSDSFV